MRFLLRSETRDSHSRLDAALITHDLTTLPGLRAFLSVHYLARMHLQKILSGYEFLRDDSEKIAMLCADFDIMDVPLPRWETEPEIGDFHSLGLIYVMAGSALGGKLLYKQWSAAQDTHVLNVKNFMTGAKDHQCWNGFLSYINAQRFDPMEMDKMIVAANYSFGVFEAANNQMNETR